MTLKPLALALGLSLSALAPQAAAELTSPEVEKIVREYLLRHPEILIEMSQALESQQQQLQAKTDAQLITTHQAALTQGGDPQAGNPKGTVTIVEFFDYNCGYCKRSAPLVAKLLAQDKSIRYIYKELPILSASSEQASQAALAVHLTQPTRYAPFHTALLAAQGPLKDLDQIKGIAEKAGVDWSKVAPELDSPVIAGLLKKNAILANQLGVSGTPAFVVGNKIIRGAPTDLAAFMKIVSSAKAP